MSCCAEWRAWGTGGTARVCARVRRGVEGCRTQWRPRRRTDSGVGTMRCTGSGAPLPGHGPPLARTAARRASRWIAGPRRTEPAQRGTPPAQVAATPGAQGPPSHPIPSSPDPDTRPQPAASQVKPAGAVRHGQRRGRRGRARGPRSSARPRMAPAARTARGPTPRSTMRSRWPRRADGRGAG